MKKYQRPYSVYRVGRTRRDELTNYAPELRKCLGCTIKMPGHPLIVGQWPWVVGVTKIIPVILLVGLTGCHPEIGSSSCAQREVGLTILVWAGTLMASLVVWAAIREFCVKPMRKRIAERHALIKARIAFLNEKKIPSPLADLQRRHGDRSCRTCTYCIPKKDPSMDECGKVGMNFKYCEILRRNECSIQDRGYCGKYGMHHQRLEPQAIDARDAMMDLEYLTSPSGDVLLEDLRMRVGWLAHWEHQNKMAITAVMNKHSAKE